MVSIGRSSHAFFFDGVSDSILIPQGRFTTIGQDVPEGHTSPVSILGTSPHGTNDITQINPKNATGLAVEAWVIPDCGGVIINREGQFKLELGNVDTAGPAKFTITLQTPQGNETIVLSTATYTATRYVGTVYPTQEVAGIHDSYNRFDTSTYGEATNLNLNHRPLMHIYAGVGKEEVFLFVNGQLMAREIMPVDGRIVDSKEHAYVGGKGGQFRGTIESLHINSSFNAQHGISNMPLLTPTSTALYRFEEPIDIIPDTYTITALGGDSSSVYSAAADGSTTTITIAATEAQALIGKLTGAAYDSTSPTIDFTASPYSMGKYKVVDYYTTPGSTTTHRVPHTPYNLLINPGAINRNTLKPNQKPPERVRLHSINGTTGVLTVSSIHVDFPNMSSALGNIGLRGVLHDRTVDIDDYFVVVGADLLIDNGTGKPYQPPHYASQIFDRTGQMILDESSLNQHALVYSSRMATTTSDATNPYAVVWPSSLDELYQIGHSGRHTFSHVAGHEFMRRLPKPKEEIVDQSIDGSADIVEIIYEPSQSGLDTMMPMNARIDTYFEQTNTSIMDIRNSDYVDVAVTNGLPAAQKEMIAIGTASMDIQPFLLKGPTVETLDNIDATTRKYHLRPETTSRIALLKVPTLQTTHDLAPFVEIHYNAIDLTGASMSKSHPMLMVEKTVPAGNYVLTGTTRVLDVILADLADASKDTTLYSPGGVIDISDSTKTSVPLMTNHGLVGDNTGGLEDDDELDESFTPANYTPMEALGVNAQPNTPPTTIQASHAVTSHESVYHKLCLEPNVSDTVTQIATSGEGNFRRAALTTKSGTGIFDIGSVQGNSAIYEMFDIIDNISQKGIAGVSTRLIVQPSDKSRTNQLAKVRGQVDYNNSPNVASIFFLMCKGRLRSSQVQENEDGSHTTIIRTAGIVSTANSVNIDVLGTGSPDSHIVKEIEPNAPVVTVTLGGPGQGAVNTKPTWDPSPLMRLPWSTRRSCAVQAVRVQSHGSTTQFLEVVPLNNNSTDIASWGTYCFPQTGRIYLSDGASAFYEKKSGVGFTFTNPAGLGSNTFLLSDGQEVATFHEWLNATGLVNNNSVGTYFVNTIIYSDLDFKDENLCQDGSTVNDRLFQTMNDVQHDYQLGTQYASTRSMVEIPLFPDQFFDNTERGIFPGPDNSMKISLDCTYTAHTWNPSPVGRRCPDYQVNDREAFSAYGMTIQEKTHTKSAHITELMYVDASDTNHYRLYVSNFGIFPNGTISAATHKNHINVMRHRRAFLTSGSWVIYVNDPATDKYLKIPKTDSENYISATFIEEHTVGASIFVASGYQSETLVPIASDNTTPSSDYENRSDYYYDQANVQTQGGNVDYGLRQYVSAVEFKAGPLDNPHAPRIESGRARLRVTNVDTSTASTFSATAGGLFRITIDNEDIHKVPEVSYTVSGGEVTLTQGETLYTLATITSTGTEEELIFLGRPSGITSPATIEPEKNTFLVYTNATSATTSWILDLVDKEVYFKKAGTSVFTSQSSPTTLIKNEKQVMTFLPSLSADQWNFPSQAISTHSSPFALNMSPATANRLLHANIVGLNVREGDKIYRQGDGVSLPSDQIDYVGTVSKVESPSVIGSGTVTKVYLTAATAVNLSFGEKLRVGVESVMKVDDEAILNKTWLNPYAQGGLRNGDTIWMNMTLNNPHAVEGMFAKSRGVLNEGLVWKGFNGGEGELAASRPRDSIPLENFLIGNTCLETAKNYVQHVNKTVEENYKALGLDASQAPTIAYVDPYQATDNYARVLLYDVAHDREAVAFQDLHMQVQSSSQAASIGIPRKYSENGTMYDTHVFNIEKNGGAPSYLTTQIDVANGFPSENKYLRSTQQSNFMESAYAHNIANNIDGYLLNASATMAPSLFDDEPLMGKGHGHVPMKHLMYINPNFNSNRVMSSSGLPRTDDAVCIPYWADLKHTKSRFSSNTNISGLVEQLISHRNAKAGASFKDPSTFFDTPDGTRVIPAYLCLKGKRATSLDLSTHEESRLQHLKHWTEMDFVRRLTIDLGEIGVKEGVTDIEAAAKEVVRLINQAGATNGRTHARRPSNQYPSESERMDLSRIGVRQDITDENKDPSAVHINADFAATGSTHDPASFWDTSQAFDNHDRGSHMGYARAHIGRVVEDINGNEGYSIVIHSTIPGASGRNFCVWLDNSKGQTTYQPQFLIGHGGRFRNFWCQPDEILGENMHPAPMPLNKHGRPFAPITTLREYIPTSGEDKFQTNADYTSVSGLYGDDNNAIMKVISMVNGSGESHNSVNEESFESQNSAYTITEGLRNGSVATSRVNFGGLVASGVPGFAPDTGIWGFGNRGDSRFNAIYGSKATASLTSIPTTYTSHVPTTDTIEDNIGTGDLYGFRLIDHRGKGHGIRYIYRKFGENYLNDNSILPSTIDDEILIHFDDSDVGQGGFTIGQHMYGVGDVTGRMTKASGTNILDSSWRGNRWNGVPGINAAIDCSLEYDESNKKITVVFEAPYNTSSTMSHFDLLGYLGFPLNNGMMQITDPMDYSVSAANQGLYGATFSYTHRSRNDKSGTHEFYGVEGSTFTASNRHFSSTIVDVVNKASFGSTGVNNKMRGLISSKINWTTLITDELIAAVTAFTINRPSFNSEEAITFDCRDMYAADGRTFGEWGVTADAIKIKPRASDKSIMSINTMFSASVHKDWGIQAAHLEFGEIATMSQDSTTSAWSISGTNRSVIDNDLDSGERVDVGYIPYTILQIQSKGKGYHANTPTPILVDSLNDPVDTSTWQQNLKGILFTRYSGDHILPAINNPVLTIQDVETSDTTLRCDVSSQKMHSSMVAAGQEGSTLIKKTGVTINNGPGYVPPGSPSTTAMTVAIASGAIGDYFTVGHTVVNAAGLPLGIVGAASGTTLTIASPGLLIPVAHLEEIYDLENTAAKRPSFGERRKMWLNSESYAVCESQNGANSEVYLVYDTTTTSSTWDALIASTNTLLAAGTFDVPLSHYGSEENTMIFDGMRYLGSVFSEPIRYFKGGKDSVDHSVPLYFGGGFSGATIDINDGTENDYSDFYTHPYANGPTGCSGIQHANEISSSFALLDCNAILAFFPGTALCNQHRGSISPPVFNKNNILSPDITGGVGVAHATHPQSAIYNTGVVVQRPIPMVLRFAHPTARYEDHRDISGTSVSNHTTYLIFGPGQAFPFTVDDADAAQEPHPGFVVSTGNTWSKVPVSKNLPNEIHNDQGQFGPMASTYQTDRGRYHWRAVMNWEPPMGKPNIGTINDKGLLQRPESGRFYGEHFIESNTVVTNNIPDYKKAHPMRHCVFPYYGVAKASDLVFHMDGGYHPGGTWYDNQLLFNPKHPKDSSSIVSVPAWNQVNPTAFRVSAAVATGMIPIDTIGTSDTEIILVDATRCQNGEELATILGLGINSFPGKGALKAMGGTFMPSMGNAQRQDRYGWIELTWVGYGGSATAIAAGNTLGALKTYSSSSLDSEIYVDAKIASATQATHEQIPQSGWIRTDQGGRKPSDPTNTLEVVPAFAPYHSREIFDTGSEWRVRFWLAPNRITGMPFLEDAETFRLHAGGTAYDSLTVPGCIGSGTLTPTKVYVWSKAGVHRYNNENETARNHMCQVHFNGLVDAIDRTRPVGVPGWAGERYSYLNSLKIGSEGYAAGLGAWHPMLGFSPYGSSSSCMSTMGHLPSAIPMINSPESSNASNGETPLGSRDFMRSKYFFNKDLLLDDYDTYYGADYVFNQQHKSLYYNKPPTTDTTISLPKYLYQPQNVYAKAFLVVAYEGELSLVAKYDRDGISATGDWLTVASKTQAGVATSTAITFAGTTQWDERFHGADRFVCTANAGPNVEAMIIDGISYPTMSDRNDAQASPFDNTYLFNPPPPADSQLNNATPCLAKTGDLFFDLDKSPGSYFVDNGASAFSTVERNLVTDYYDGSAADHLNDDYGNTTQGNAYWLNDINAYEMNARSSAHNFSVEHIVWKRMDGGSLSLPASNARGLGAVPWVTRVNGSTPYTTGEVIYGNNRFSFETTNSAMFPIIQSQELSHPQIAARHPNELRNILEIPNEEIQFEEISVTDDTGQIHTIEGGSPLGTIIRGFRSISDRTSEGLAPSIANSGIEPNLKIQLPDPNSIPGNIIVRSGFDRLQAYQTETMGSGGMLHPDLGVSHVGHMFDNSVEGPRLGPTFDNHNWEHISQRADGVAFPDSSEEGWKNATNDNPLKSSYELHDRTLFFHITKVGHSHTHRYPTTYTHSTGIVTNDLNAASYSGTTLTVGATVNANVFAATFGSQDIDNTSAVMSASNRRRYLRIYNPTTGDSGVATYTGITGSTFTGCVGDTDFDRIVASSTITSYKVVPSYYVPAGSARFFAARRVRDHAEVSGNSPDMSHTKYLDGGLPVDQAPTRLIRDLYRQQRLTPMPIPRMGHHFVNATMPMLPGHWAHPAYQGLYSKHMACNAATVDIEEKTLIDSAGNHTLKAGIASSTTKKMNALDPVLRFGSLTATPSGPSDIHGGGFSLLFESKIRYDGYGVLASLGQGGVVNKSGGHSITLEAAGNYSLLNYFPDPKEVGAYQIVIQPNLHKSQLYGYHDNGAATALPDGTVTELTNQQVNLVIGIKEDYSTKGSLTLVLAEATMADVRGCEVFINEIMLDHDPDFGSQFTNIPPLLLYNALGVQGTETPAFTRISLPYHPGMFFNSTPGYTMNIPWWSLMHSIGPDDSGATGFRHLTQSRFDNYYEFCRAGAGSIGGQLTLAGYPSLYPDIYSPVLGNVSLNPRCTVIELDRDGATSPASWNTAGLAAIKVDDARAFLETPYYGQVLEYTDATGVRRTSGYTYRSGGRQTPTNKPYMFTFGGDHVPGSSSNDGFWDNLTVGTVLRLSQAYDNKPADFIYTESKSSIVPRILPQLLQGSRDTSSLHLADAFLCLWHPNLGRPHTYYSDSSRTWLNPTSDRALDKKPYNNIPEHFETVHYHDASYYASMGPFGHQMSTPAPPEDTGLTVNTAVASTHDLTVNENPSGLSSGDILVCENKILGTFNGNTATAAPRWEIGIAGTFTMPSNGAKIYTGALGDGFSANTIDAMTGYNHQGGQYDAGTATTKTMLNKFWSSGSRGGPLVSKLEGYAYVSTSWTKPREYTYAYTEWTDADDDGSYSVSSGITATALAATKRIPFGYRFGIGQPFNRPQWGLYGTRGYIEATTVAVTGVAINNGGGYSSSTTGAMNTDGVAANAIFAEGDIVYKSDGTTIGAVTAVSASSVTVGGGTAASLADDDLLYISSVTNILSGHSHGPVVQLESRTTGNKWEYAGGNSLTNVDFDVSYVGIMERQTNFTGMLGVDKPEFQVKYSDGRRMTRPFGCPVRTLRNPTEIRKDWWGDDGNKALATIQQAVDYYLVDWWGNTRGEDVRRFPVRGFGIRPAWDPTDAYEVDRYQNEGPYLRLFDAASFPLFNMKGVVATGATDVTGAHATIPRFGGIINNYNNNSTTTLVDVFAPTHSLRVGDMGNGRGVRYPTSFNEDVLMELNEETSATGLVLSHNTAEPITGKGYLRPRNDVLQSNEVPRGISARLEIAEDGLLKPEATVSDRTETISGTSVHKDAISRSTPRIGIDADTLEDVDVSNIIINTEAHSLHTDRNVGQRMLVHGGMQATSQTLTDYDLTSLSFAAQPHGGVMRLSHTNPFAPLGGTYILESRNYLQPISDAGWGETITRNGLVLHLMADSLNLDDGDVVASWKSSGPIDFEFTQGTASAQPTYIASSSVINNMPAIDCDGNDSLSLDFDARLNTAEMTVFVVAWIDSDDGNIHGIVESRVTASGVNSGFNMYIRADSHKDYQFWSGGNTGWNVADSALNSLTAGAAKVLTGMLEGGDGVGSVGDTSLYVDGTLADTANAAYWVAPSSNYNLGRVPSSFYLNGKIAEVIQYDRALSDSERERVEGYLANKYGLTTSVDSKNSNPYSSGYTPSSTTQMNTADYSMYFMLRPIRTLDKQHIELFRPNNALHSSANQYGSNYFAATSGGKYGVYSYDMPNARATTTGYIRSTNPDTNPPYAPVYHMDISNSDTVPISKGPKILGTEVAGFDKTTLGSTVSRVIISENTLQHHRSDSPRRRTSVDSDEKELRSDYTVKPRFSQSLHPKGHKEDVTFGTSDHSGDGS